MPPISYPLAIEDRFETKDGSRPTAAVKDELFQERFPLAAFKILLREDVFENHSLSRLQTHAQNNKAAVQAYLQNKLQVQDRASNPWVLQRLEEDIHKLLSNSQNLIPRLQASKNIVIEIINEPYSLADFNYPDTLAAEADGVFWDQENWPAAKIALKAKPFKENPILLIHEMAHAIHYLAFTPSERQLIYRLLAPTFFAKNAMDEVFAIYTEREFLPEFSKESKQAGGVYGFTRNTWSEDHVFTRFIRKLYFPYKPLAGPSMQTKPEAHKLLRPPKKLPVI